MNTDHLERLSLDRIGKLAGGLAADAIDAAILAAVNDLSRRPEDRRGRKVVFTVTLTPATGPHVDVRFDAKPVLPGRTPPAVAVRGGDLGKADPGLLFNPYSATHIDQLPLPFGGDADGANAPRSDEPGDQEDA